MCLLYKVLLCSIINVGSWLWVEGNLYTAIASVEPLLQTHQVVINYLDDYISKEEERISLLKKNLVLYKHEHSKAMEDIPNYLGNPLNIFTLIKRLTSDLQNIERSVMFGTELIKNVTNSQEVIYPTKADLVGAAKALIRLQDTYRLNVTELSNGKLNNVAYSTPLTASDCFELGRALFEQMDYNHSLSWMIQALRKYKEKDQPYIQLTEVDILEYISFTYYSLNEVENAIIWTRKLLELDPKHPKANFNVIYYENLIKQNTTDGTLLQPNELNNVNTISNDFGLYDALCRGDVQISMEVSKRLKCRYVTENHPFLILAPFKVEQLYIEPDIFLYYDVISDHEIEQVKDIAKPKLRRATVSKGFGDGNTGNTYVDYRISMSAWVSDEESPAVARLSRRVSHMTGLDSVWAEKLQIGNYGVGGHYVPHYDFALKDENETDNRIATVLFYMSSVAEGGATVFTELGLSVSPVKNAAAFWMNLHPSGEGDLATRHAACPVLRGSKWVSNKWIHQNGQELLKPCDLEYQEEGIKRKLPSPILK